jgi:hypothetical protein
MCREITLAYEVDEVKDIRDKAIAWEIYSRQAHNVDAERLACEIRLRAERKAGQLLKQMQKAKASAGNQHTGKLDRRPRGGGPTLAELGVSEKQSRQWQKLADVPDKQFAAALADRTAKPTTNGIIQAGLLKPGIVKVSDDALWLCGRLKDFERMGLLGKEPSRILLTMVPTMLDSVHRLAPKVAAWLRRIGEIS